MSHPSFRATSRLAAIALATALAIPSLASGPAAVSAATTMSVAVTADAQVKSSSPTKNYGATTELRARDGATDLHRSFLSFVVPVFTGTPQGAAIRVYVTDPSFGGGKIHRVTGAWTESGVTWVTAPAYDAVAMANAPATPVAGQWFSIAIPVSAVRSGARLDLAIVGTNTNSVKYTSRETTTAPSLVLSFNSTSPTPVPTPVPVPAATPAPTAIPTPKPSTTPAPTGTASPVPTAAPTAVPTAVPTPKPTTIPTASPSTPPTAGVGVLVDRAYILSLPTTGSAWQNLKSYADSAAGSPDIQNQDSANDIHVLAKALVYARTGDATYRTSVIATLKAAVGTEDGGRTLALARNLPGYVIAADLVGLSSADAPFNINTFRPWLRGLLSETLSGDTLRSTHEERPNNWGTHAGAARAAVAAYLGDSAEMARTAKVFKGWLGDRTSYAGFSYGDVSWQSDSTKPVGINPVGATKNGVAVGGALPDDMRRGASFQWPAVFTDYPWEAMQGVMLQALILDHAGYDAFGWQNQAIRRASDFLYDRAGWAPHGDDTWQPWVINHAYRTNRAAGTASAGKNMSFTDWLYAD